MTTNSPPKFDPLTGLLPPGIHPISHEQFRDRCVDSLTAELFWSNGREEMFSGYEKLVEALALVNIETRQLVNSNSPAITA